MIWIKIYSGGEKKIEVLGDNKHRLYHVAT